METVIFIQSNFLVWRTFGNEFLRCGDSTGNSETAGSIKTDSSGALVFGNSSGQGVAIQGDQPATQDTAGKLYVSGDDLYYVDSQNGVRRVIGEPNEAKGFSLTTSDEDSGIQLSWSPISRDCLDRVYDVYRCTDGGDVDCNDTNNYSLIQSGLSVTSFVDQSVADGTTYSYFIRKRLTLADGSTEDTADSNVSTETYTEPIPQVMPDNLDWTIEAFPDPNSCDGQYRASWNNTSDDFQIQIQIRESGNFEIDVDEILTSGTSSYLFTSACDEEEYLFRLRYKSSAGDGDYTDWHAQGDPVVVPEISGSALSDSEIEIETVKGFLNQPFDLYRNGSYIGSYSNEFTDTGLNESTTYSYYAIDQNGAESNTVNVTTQDAPNLEPENLTAGQEFGSISLDWDPPPAGNPNSYELQGKEDTSSSWNQIDGSIAGTDTTYSHNVCNEIWFSGDGGNVDYRLRAIHSSGTSDWVTVTYEDVFCF